MKISLILILYVIPSILFSQIKSSDSIPRTPFDINKIKESVRLAGTSEVFSYDSLYIWSDKRSLSEIMDERPGYFVNNFGFGQRNVINHNGFSEKDIGIFRDGIQVNDILFGGFDIQNISINEIDRVEEISNVSSFLYSANSTGKSINIITKDIVQSKPFSQLRYSQDRDNSLYADVFFTLPFSRKINWMVGATKHSIGGRYINSEFDSWMGRTRLNFYSSQQFNLNINFNYDNIKRELNEGLLFKSGEDSLSNSNAAVVNQTSNEDITNFYYDAIITARLFKERNSLTKLKLYSINSLRKYDNQDTIILSGNSKVFFKPTSYHYIQYAADLKHNLNYKLSRNSSIDLLIGGNAYFNFDDGKFIYKKFYDQYSFLFRGDFKIRNFLVSVFSRLDEIVKDGSNPFLNFGAEASYNLNLGLSSYLKFHGGINRLKYNTVLFLEPSIFIENDKTSRNYFEAGFEFGISRILKINSYYFENPSPIHFLNFNFANRGLNTSITFKSKFIDLNLYHNYWDSNIFPNNYLKSDLSYHNLFFGGKLNIRMGLNAKYFSSPENFYFYSQSIYDFFYAERKEVQRNGFQIDFYVGARIGRANINITIANLFDNFFYNTFLYPADNRGGFVNSISRFTIVWDFIN